MKRYIVSIILILSLIATSTVAFAGDKGAPAPIHAMAALTSIDLTLESKSNSSSTASSMPWGSSLTYRADIYWDDGWHEVDSFAVVDWSLTDQSGNATQAWTKKWRGADGVARIKIFVPYGMIGSLTLKAVSHIDNTLIATQNIAVTDGTSTTGTRFYRSLFGAEVPKIETWDNVKGTYTTKLLPIPDSVYYDPDEIPTTFRWVLFVNENEAGKKYMPNEAVSLSVDQYESCYIDETVRVKMDPPLPPVYYKSINGVYVLPTTRSVILTWNRVESAKGYFIYKYNTTKKKYTKVATLKGRIKTGWTDNNVEAEKTYKYKVQPYKIVKGKKKKLRSSKWVSAIVGSVEYSNALNVKLSPSKAIKKKAGKTAKLNATVSGIPGKTLITSKVRWYSSNKKIATVSKSGKVKFKKKGTCHIWAKAHNGKNSKKIKIVVR